MLRMLRNEITPYTNAWRTIAINLDISYVDIERIATQNRSEQDCLNEVFVTWHKQCKHPFTWNTILRVLEEPSVGESHLAQEVHKKHCEGDTCYKCIL